MPLSLLTSYKTHSNYQLLNHNTKNNFRQLIPLLQLRLSQQTDVLSINYNDNNDQNELDKKPKTNVVSPSKISKQNNNKYNSKTNNSANKNSANKYKNRLANASLVPFDAKRLDKLWKNRRDDDVDSFTKNMKTLAYQHDGINIADTIQEILEDWEELDMNILDPAIITDWMWSLGRLGFSLGISAQKSTVFKLLHIFSKTDNLTPRQVTTCFGGLSKLQMKWQYLGVDIKKDIMSAIGSVCTDLYDREIGNLLHSLSKMNVFWEVIPIAIQNGLLEVVLL